MSDAYEEYSVGKYDGYLLLAIAVVKQWVNDGRPKGDKKNIEPWIDLIKLHLPEVNIERLLTSAVVDQLV